MYEVIYWFKILKGNKMNMVEHEEFLIKLDLAHDIDISNENLKKLSEDKDYIVRLALAGKPNTPKDILITLSKDKHDYVKEVAFKRLEDLKDQIVDVATNDFNSL